MNKSTLQVAVAIISFSVLIIFGAATGFFIPNQQSDNLVQESLIPVAATCVFSLVTGYLAGGESGSLPPGILGGAANALVNLGLLFLVLIAKDRHFVAIGGRTLAAWLPAAALHGAVFGMIGASIRRLLRTKRAIEGVH